MIESGILSEKGGAQKMMRRGILLLLSLGLVLVCSGCSNRQEDTGEPEVSEQNVSSEGGRQEDSETDRRVE